MDKKGGVKAAFFILPKNGKKYHFLNKYLEGKIYGNKRNRRQQMAREH